MTPEIAGQCDINYIYEPLTEYRRTILDVLGCYTPQESALLDLGCGAVGFYWALSYLNKVNSVSFADRNDEMLEILSSRMDGLTPETLTEAFKDSAPAGFDAETFLAELHRKTADVFAVDILQTPTPRKYDAILTLEVLDCAQTESELQIMASNVAASLDNGGRLIGCCLNYKEWSAELAALATQRLAGILNPSLEQVTLAIENAGLRIIYAENRPTGMSKYPLAHFFCAEKG